ncbi:hypothetical protein ANCCAN_18488 [Ancylostoma caninum]|uniref:Uncharacterized protein n=1 Tax=Ancylostoma caninum TaxID=29170 RepID=A0A368FU84_ANCCA|nr:hypothetical protein ANCCAN_18488 [Ancylostoma caninum]
MDGKWLLQQRQQDYHVSRLRGKARERSRDTIDEAHDEISELSLETSTHLGGDRHGIKSTVGSFASSEHLSDNGE